MTGFGYTSHDLPEDVIDEAYAKFATFFSMDQAAKSQLHPRRRKYPHRYMDQVLPEAAVPGITEVLVLFHERIHDLQRRFRRIIASGSAPPRSSSSRCSHAAQRSLGRSATPPPMPEAPSGESHVWAGEHADINLITALPRAR